jgi:hypothetical protein
MSDGNESEYDAAGRRLLAGSTSTASIISPLLESKENDSDVEEEQEGLAAPMQPV